MVCVNILMKKRNVANCVFKDDNFNFLSVMYFLEEMFKNYNRNLFNETRDEVLAVKMLIGGYQNYCGYGKHIDFPKATREYMEKKYPDITFCKLNEKTKFYISAEPSDVDRALRENRYIVVVDMDERIISHNLFKEATPVFSTKSSERLNARINDFPICDINTIKTFLVNNMKKYFLDEKGDKAYFIDNTTFF